MSQASLIFAVVALFATATLAEEPPHATGANATWTDAGHVKLSVTWEGGACEEAGEPTVETTQSDQDIVAVTIPTTSTAEVCTQQLVELSYVGEIAVEPHTGVLAITVLAPDGTPRASSYVTIASAGAPIG